MSGIWPLLLYVGLLLALFIRFQSPDAVRPPVHLVAAPEHLRLVRRYHRTFYAVLLAAPIEWLIRGRPAAGSQLIGAALFLAGVIGYRRAGAALGEQLSPLIAPRPPVVLIERGPYRSVRHPMSLAALAMAFGAPLLLGARVSWLVSVVFTALVVQRIAVEEQALAGALPEYRAYAARTYRLVPYVY